MWTHLGIFFSILLDLWRFVGRSSNGRFCVNSQKHICSSKAFDWILNRAFSGRNRMHKNHVILCIILMPSRRLVQYYFILSSIVSMFRKLARLLCGNPQHQYITLSRTTELDVNKYRSGCATLPHCATCVCHMTTPRWRIELILDLYSLSLTHALSNSKYSMCCCVTKHFVLNLLKCP